MCILMIGLDKGEMMAKMTVPIGTRYAKTEGTSNPNITGLEVRGSCSSVRAPRASCQEAQPHSIRVFLLAGRQRMRVSKQSLNSGYTAKRSAISTPRICRADCLRGTAEDAGSVATRRYRENRSLMGTLGVKPGAAAAYGHP